MAECFLAPPNNSFHEHMDLPRIAGEYNVPRTDAFKVQTIDLDAYMKGAMYNPSLTILQNALLQQYVHRTCRRLPVEPLSDKVQEGLNALLKNDHFMYLANSLSRSHDASV